MAKNSDTLNGYLQLQLRYRFLRQYVDDIESEQKTSAAEYRAALRRINVVKAALGTRRQSQVATSNRIIRQGDPGFAEAERKWKAQRFTRR
jgi:hypothetical protein